MSRPKKDPELRRGEFIQAAKQLFFSNGYKTVSIQDILKAVGDKSVSPSVFYYYFSSKDDIYHAVMESYCEEYIMVLERCFSDENVAVEERFINAMKVMTATLSESLGRVNDSDAADNRLFALDLRDRTTGRIAGMMAEALKKYPIPGKSPKHKRYMSMYITGGIGEIINNIVFSPEITEKDMKEIMNDIIQFTADVAGVPKSLLRRLVRKI